MGERIITWLNQGQARTFEAERGQDLQSANNHDVASQALVTRQHRKVNPALGKLNAPTETMGLSDTGSQRIMKESGIFNQAKLTT